MKHIIISFTENTNPDTNTINIQDINNIPNMFFDKILVKNELNLSLASVTETLDSILSKVKPGGVIECSILDLKVISQYFINGLIEDTQYLNTIKRMNHCLSFNNILIYAKNKVNISVNNVSYNEYIISFKINRLSV